MDILGIIIKYLSSGELPGQVWKEGESEDDHDERDGSV